MRLFPRELPIGDYDGFKDEFDIFLLKSFGESLKNLFEKVDDPMVAILDEPWGAGKSSFIKMWCGHMRLHGFPVIYFDAFKHDYSDDAFIAIAGEVVAAAQDLKPPEEIIDGIVDTTVKLSLAAGKGLLKNKIRKVIGEEAEEDIQDLLQDGAGLVWGEIEAGLRSKLKSRREERNSYKEFGTKLSKVAQLLSDGANEKEKQHDGFVSEDIKEWNYKPLIFVIDELDRCKPTFALDILEKIKHFFSRDGIHFFLVTHMEQLECAVSSIYGLGSHADTYLEKFYDLRVKFPSKDNSHLKTNYSFGHYLLEIIDSDQDSRSNDFVHALELLCENKAVDLRTMSKIATRYFLARRGRLAKENPYILLFLCLIFHLDNILYSKIRSGTVNVEEVAKIINFENDSSENEVFLSSLICCLVPFERMDSKWQEHYRNGNHAFWNYKETTKPLIKIIDSIL